ncbi:DUF262 domain-containing protein [Rathayibacter soli]|uniref:DUF262 domain-containing protein n=1 Tax=Rathayibacter soli TaxID=3144168 RepID=UPI0027E40C15|nr:DUF262 domain-containing protein [Glaciibacter superstes]
MDAVLDERLVLASDDPSRPHVQGEFVVPPYQRGYRWGEVETHQLLDDINSSPVDRGYYLQPVVVLKRPDGTWELVDGQQRLTTLYLILRYIGTKLPNATVDYSLTYETRAGSREYLETLDPARSNENVDFFHMAKAYEAIESWFESRGNPLLVAVDMYQALSKRVFVIWYEAPADTTNANALFARLNRDRIPLTDAELIKALILSESATRDDHSGRRAEIAAQWDGIERELREDQFWAFLTGTSAGRPTHIDFVFESLTRASSSHHRPPYWTFEQVRERVKQTSAAEFWREVVEIFGTLKGWFNDRELFHRIGYLVAIGDNIQDLIAISRLTTHSMFRQELQRRIRERLVLTRESASLLRYDKNPMRCEWVLLLMNVQSILGSADKGSRFSFHAYAQGGWSLEHIHAQNAQLLRTDAQRSDWIEAHLHAIRVTPWEAPNQVTAQNLAHDLEAQKSSSVRISDDDAFQRLVDRVFDLFSAGGDEDDEEMHGIANLALLQKNFNSKLNNAVFALKRERIIELDEAGAFILPCTRNVFLKYYTRSEDQQLSLWSPQDREQYLEKLLVLVDEFLLVESEGEAAA